MERVMTQPHCRSRQMYSPHTDMHIATHNHPCTNLVSDVGADPASTLAVAVAVCADGDGIARSASSMVPAARAIFSTPAYGRHDDTYKQQLVAQGS